MRPKPPFAAFLAVNVTLAALAAAHSVAGVTGITPNYSKADTARWRCRLCPFEAVQSKGSVTAGVIHVDGPQPRLGRDDGPGGKASISAWMPITAGAMKTAARWNRR